MNTQYEPFDLARAKDGEPIMTRGGLNVIEWHYFQNLKDKYPIAALIEGDSEFGAYTSNGLFDDSDLSPNTLVMKPKAPILRYCVIEMYPHLKYPADQIKIHANCATREEAEKEKDLWQTRCRDLKYFIAEIYVPQ